MSEVASERVYIDFQKLDDWRRPILSAAGTVRDLERLGIELREGLTVAFYSDDEDDQGNPDPLLVEGTVRFDDEHRRWVAEISWEEIRHASDSEK